MDKKTLQEILKKLPADARKIRVAALWNRAIGDFEYVSFDSNANMLGEFEMNSPGSQPTGEGAGYNWIKRMPKEKENA